MLLLDALHLVMPPVVIDTVLAPFLNMPVDVFPLYDTDGVLVLPSVVCKEVRYLLIYCTERNSVRGNASIRLDKSLD